MVTSRSLRKNRPLPQVTLWSSLPFAAFLADSVELREKHLWCGSQALYCHPL